MIQNEEPWSMFCPLKNVDATTPAIVTWEWRIVEIPLFPSPITDKNIKQSSSHKIPSSSPDTLKDKNTLSNTLKNSTRHQVKFSPGRKLLLLTFSFRLKRLKGKKKRRSKMVMRRTTTICMQILLPFKPPTFSTMLILMMLKPGASRTAAPARHRTVLSVAN